jgi:hypothetical protein
MYIILIILILVIALFSNVLVERFLFLDPAAFSNDASEINKNMLMHSMIIPESEYKTATENRTIQILGTSNAKLLNNIIRFSDDSIIKWSKWTESEDPNNLSKQIFQYINAKVRAVDKTIKIVLFKLNKSRYGEADLCMFDYDIVFYKQGENYASHYKVLCVTDNGKKIHFVYLKMVGSINQDKIFGYDNDSESDNVEIDPVTFHSPISNDDTLLNMEDEEVQDILYSKMIQHDDPNTDASDIYDDNQKYVKNNLFQKTYIRCKKSYKYKSV